MTSTSELLCHSIAVVSSNPPAASIVMPYYLGERYVNDAIRSCLGQTFSDFELIIIDDASPCSGRVLNDGLIGIDSRIQFVRLERNCGVAEAFNAGFRLARGEYLTRLAQDDIFKPSALAVMVDYLNKHSDVGMVYCDEDRVDEAGRFISSLCRPEPEAALRDGNKLGFCAMWRRRVWEEVGEFDSRYDTVEDYDYWLRVARRFKIGHSSAGPQISVRMHPEMGSLKFSIKQKLLGDTLRWRFGTTGLKRRRRMAGSYFEAGYQYRENGQLLKALTHLLISLIYWPFNLLTYKAALGSCWRLSRRVL